jgi:hypothetical protein
MRESFEQFINSQNLPPEKEEKPEATEIKNEESELNEIDLPPIAEWEISKDIKGDTCQFFDVPGHPELLGRKMDFMPDDKPELSRSEAKEYWKKCITEFKKIVHRYDMRIPKTRFVFDDDETSGKPSFFAVTERINGESLNKIPTFDKKAAEELDTMYTGILSHTKESYLEDGYVWGDFAANQQIMYGTEPNGNKSEEEEPHPYLIDVEPRVSLWKDTVDPEDTRSLEEKKEHAFWQSFSYTVFEMAETELKTESGRKSFAKSREALAKMVKELPEPNGQDTKNIRLRVLGEV